jgi:putative RNA 2'-phosphotransferase
MDPKRLVKVSRYLSRHLRHQPERLGLSLQAGGWVEVDELLAACAAHSFALSRDELQVVVDRNDKCRFSFDAGGTRIRANQGHSVEIDLGLEPAEPPAVLFHGTAQARLDAILAEGLRKMGRHHVHLSADAETATRVGARHGKPVVLEVAAARMAAAGHDFFVTANGVWLIDAVPPDFLTPR